MRLLVLAFTATLPLALAMPPAFALATDVPPPAACTPQVNQGLQTLVLSKTTKDVDNIMVCGDAVGKTKLQGGGPHGSHHVTTLSVPLPNGSTIRVQVVVNDSLDGVVTANPGDHVMAFGQGYVTHGQAQAGVHDVHCSTHPTADNGWVYIDGKLATPSCH
jgi:hypothetical protein